MLIADHRVSDGVDGSNPGPQGLGARTRDQARQMIAEAGPITAAVFASRLGLTPAAVRRHLDLLAEQGAIEAREPASVGGSGRGRGRPARAYILSEAVHAGMDSDYDDSCPWRSRLHDVHPHERRSHQRTVRNYHL